MSTYSPIASVTLASATAEVNFTNIPQTYTDLIMVITGVSNSGDNIFYRFNGVTSSSYSRTDLIGTGSSALSGGASNQTVGRLTNYGYPSSTAGNQVTIWQISNYSNTTTYKTSISRSNAAGTGVDAIVNLFSSTNAITSISIATNQFSGTQNWQSGTTVNLYGVANASITNVAKATGGDSVYTDGTYWYHIFNSSGTFTPTQALTCDYLVVAGGGGGADYGGGGGAGGYRTTVGTSGGGGSAETPLSLVASSYTVTVGAGGAGGAANGGGNNNGAQGGNSVFATITSTGGGFGGGSVNGGGGGSGGGGGNANGLNGGAGTANQGFNGGNSTSTGGSAGGGAGANGANQTTGIGGVGLSSSITGSATFRAGGGGSTNVNGTGGAGGNGGGGAGGLIANPGTAGTAGTANTGGGGGGGGFLNAPPYTSRGGGAGGSGIVIVRYAV